MNHSKLTRSGKCEPIETRSCAAALCHSVLSSYIMDNKIITNLITQEHYRMANALHSLYNPRDPSLSVKKTRRKLISR